MTDPRRTVGERAAALFRETLATTISADATPDLYPSVIATAAQQTLRSDGAGLSIVDARHRVPVGASTTHVAAAERLQFTVGAGPCLEALDLGRPVRVDAAQMQQEWPAFYDELEQQTPYRSIVAVPLQLSRHVWAALDLYFHSEQMPGYATMTAASAVGHEIERALALAEATAGRDAGWQAGDLPDWAYGPGSRARLRTWIAVGMVVVDLDLDVDDALARLRAHAYGADTTLDQVAGELVDGVRSVRDLD